LEVKNPGSATAGSKFFITYNLSIGSSTVGEMSIKCREMLKNREAPALSSRLVPVILTGLMCLSGLIGKVQGDTIRLGGEGGRPWPGGGGDIAPVFIVGPQAVDTGNTPGGVINFAFRENWIFPTSADVTENIALGLLDRGGAVTAPTLLENLGAVLQTVIDNNGSTAFERKSTLIRRINALGVVIQLDLGARFGVSRIRFFPRNAHPDFLAPNLPFQDDYLRGYEILLNDGRKETLSGGLPVFTSILLDLQNEDPVVDLLIDPQYVRFLRIRSHTTIGFELAEIQVFGEGFVPVASYLSDLLELGRGQRLGLWGDLRWVEESLGDPRRSRLEIRTRSGMDDTPVVFNRIRTDLDQESVPWKKADAFDAGSDEEELTAQLDHPDLSVRQALILFKDLTLEQRNEIALTQDDHRKLRTAEKGPVRDDIQDWSPWSPPYSPTGVVTAEEIEAETGGIKILSPGARRYFQFKADFSSEELFSAKGIGSLSFDFSAQSLAREIIAEISPREAELGEITEFSYTIVPDIRTASDLGFGSFEITTPVQVASIGTVELSLPGGTPMAEDFSQEDLTNLAAPLAKGEFSIDLVEDDRFRIRFPEIRNSRPEAGTPALLRINFKGVVLRNGTAFSGRALPANPEDFPQETTGGNAFDLSEGGVLLRNPADLVVKAPIKGKFLINVAAIPQVFTPNGDDINDLTTINYDLTRLIGEARTTVRVYDLSGRLVKEEVQNYKSGRYSWSWNGTDVSEKLVPPGIYLFRLAVDTDTESEKMSGTVAVVY